MQIPYPKYMFLRIMETLLTEPVHMIRASAAYLLGWKEHFNFYRLNPKEITKEQAEKDPTLLLHGNIHNQSAWLGFAHHFAKAGISPVYTLNLPQGVLTEKDPQLIDAKIQEIKNQYKRLGKNDIRVNLVGHSRGAKIALYMGVEKECWILVDHQAVLTGAPLVPRKDIGKIIRLGYPTEEWDFTHFGFLEDVYDISGKRDVIVTHKSRLPPGHFMEADCGHIGLLYDLQVYQQVIEWLSQRK